MWKISHNYPPHHPASGLCLNYRLRLIQTLSTSNCPKSDWDVNPEIIRWPFCFRGSSWPDWSLKRLWLLIRHWTIVQTEWHDKNVSFTAVKKRGIDPTRSLWYSFSPYSVEFELAWKTRAVRCFGRPYKTNWFIRRRYCVHGWFGAVRRHCSRSAESRIPCTGAKIYTWDFYLGITSSSRGLFYLLVETAPSLYKWHDWEPGRNNRRHTRGELYLYLLWRNTAVCMAGP